MVRPAPARWFRNGRSGSNRGPVSHEIALRYLPGVVPAMRFRDDARVFHIVSVINVDERNRWLKCLCEERDL